MTNHSMRFNGLAASLLASALLLGLTGCGQTEAVFKSNLVYTVKLEEENDAQLGEREADIDEVLTAMFGTPDEPHVPSFAEFDSSTVLNLERLKMAAGPVGTEQGRPRGLYREWCAHCHGVTGDGLGPTAAFLNPYPRDYRPGKYKFKSTPIGYAPTHADLRKIVENGVPGTAMPAHKLLPADEVDALVHYVKYLSIRGQLERDLLTMTFTEFSPEDRLIDVANSKSSDAEKRAMYDERLAMVRDMAQTIFESWAAAEAMVTPVPKRPETLDREEAIARGREIFYTTANCNKCHGDAALGDGQTTDYDLWAKELITTPENPELMERYLSVGALEPRNIRPRNLRQGVYRGGRSPVDIYWRVMNGIEGTPMPGLSANVLKEGDPPDPKKLTEEDVWCLIEYVRNLPYEPVSLPRGEEPKFQRDRN